MSTDCPILFLVFNRPEFTESVFEELKKAKPRRLFVAADGPRVGVPGEAERCQLVRDIFKRVDWDCDLRTRFADHNRGCGKGVSSAITWFFNQVEAGIILEDDCVPDQTFFAYCQEMLQRYEDDPRIMSISGDNFQDGQVSGDGSYYFSKLPHCWGWATWRRVWALYDFHMTGFPEFSETKAIAAFHKDPAIQAFLTDLFKGMYETPIDTWDIQFFFTVARNRGLCVLPNVNLITNLGFGPNATHTFEPNSKLANLKRCSLEHIVHPSTIDWNQQADTYTFRNVYGVNAKQPVA